jgi:predicted metal-binding protein
MEKYVKLAKKLAMVDARIISPREIVFDIRAILKCRWGCEDYFKEDVRCHTRGTSFQERVAMINQYHQVLVIQSHEARALSQAAIKIERAAFLDGHYFAFAVRTCNLCRACAVQEGLACPTPEKIRPCDQSFGIDVYKTVRNLGWPCEVLRNKDGLQNRYGFVLID